MILDLYKIFYFIIWSLHLIQYKYYKSSLYIQNPLQVFSSDHDKGE